MISYEKVPFQLFKDKVVEASKATHPNFTCYFLGEMAISDFKGRYVKELPSVSFSLYINYSELADVCFKEFDTAFISFSNNEYFLNVHLEIKKSEWKEAFRLDFFPDVVREELISHGVRLRSDEPADITEGFLDHDFTLHLRTDRDLYDEIEKCLKAYKSSFISALLRINSLDIKIIEKKITGIGYADSSASVFHPIVVNMLSSPKLSVKFLGFIAVTVFLISTVIGVMADYIEVFG